MNHSIVRIQVESELSKDIWNSIEGDVISNLMDQAKTEKDGNYFKSILEGHSFRVTGELTPRLFEIFNEVCSKLNFKEQVDFYVTNSAEVNAFSSMRPEPDQPHIININSMLVDKFDEDELKFVIGHEIGHIISNNTRINEILGFIFPDENRIPILLLNKMNVWHKMAELTADRYGLIACESLEKCISGFFKLSSGLDIAKTNFDYRSFLKENNNRLEYFKKEKAGNMSSHPVNPIRIKAIEHFYESDMFQSIKKGKECKQDKALEKEMAELTQLLFTIRGSELDYQRSIYVASAGLIMAAVDDNLNETEYEAILLTLANYLIFPLELLKQIADKGSQTELFQSSAQRIMQINPIEREAMFDYLITIALSDRVILEKEINLLSDIGKNLFQFSTMEIAQRIGYQIQQGFIPKMNH